MDVIGHGHLMGVKDKEVGVLIRVMVDAGWSVNFSCKAESGELIYTIFSECKTVRGEVLIVHKSTDMRIALEAVHREVMLLAVPY